MTTDPFLANLYVEKPQIPDNYRSTDLLRNSKQTALGQRLYSETMPKGQDHGLAFELVDLWLPQKKEAAWTQEVCYLVWVTSLRLETYVPTSGWNTAGNNSRDVWVRRKTVLMSRPFRCRMQNSGWNLDRESLSLWISVFPLSHETTLTPIAVFYISTKGNSLTDIIETPSPHFLDNLHLWF